MFDPQRSHFWPVVFLRSYQRSCLPIYPELFVLVPVTTLKLRGKLHLSAFLHKFCHFDGVSIVSVVAPGAVLMVPGAIAGWFTL